MSTNTEPFFDEIAIYLQKARNAQKKIANYSQVQVDELVTAVCWAVVRQDHAEQLAKLAVDEGGFGNYSDKVSKIRNRCMGTLRDMQDVKTVGIVEEIPEKGLIKIAKPVGVVAALIPTTGPDATPPLKTLMALKGRNAIIIAAHPRTQKTTELTVKFMREACEQVGAPADLVQVIEKPSLLKTQQLMQHADLIIATGGAGMVKAAYSSGTPAYGVGVGNAVHVVDETGDLDDAANTITIAKKFDYATSCLADNAVVAHESIYDELVNRLQKLGAYLCSNAEKAKLQKLMWPDPETHIPSVDVIAKPAVHIAKLAGVTVPDACSCLMVEENGTGPDYPFSGEKLSPVLALYKYSGVIDNAIDQVNVITDYQGQGHTCGIHTAKDGHALALAMKTKTARVMVNQSLNEGAGSPRNGMPYTLSLSCGTWGGNVTTENVNARHMVNLTWVSRPITARVIDENQLFEKHWQKYSR
ncbi:Sulfoacetaldehyde dehydrogenase (Acylating) [Crenothrix polyspora]|uniref:Sulfoacetaldehyde dehydrogenase (Acylating) n=1 Tax=Crenothrix polyspora TaxID=360316 RepID=A0A1R4H3L2_9GAMM|nr:aldehyde dehydrogenase family protein [Crenothrix polyspora]SJM90832.1 Sulfoacetaldehyde dehydrogenase (Acylating) [Crenothrix polyspora]